MIFHQIPSFIKLGIRIGYYTKGKKSIDYSAYRKAKNPPI